MIKIIKVIISRLTMVKNQTLFWDGKGGRVVSEYIDCYGKKWMAQSRVGMRVELKPKEDERRNK